MDKKWIVVGNSGGARIFTSAPPAPRSGGQQPAETDGGTALSQLVEQENLEHPAGRQKAQAMDADRPGRSFESAGSKRHAMTREIDPKKQEVMNFARRLAGKLDAARRRGELERLIIVAAPEFLGLLRDSSSADLRRITEVELSLDLYNMTAAEIRTHLPAELFAAGAIR